MGRVTAMAVLTLIALWGTACSDDDSGAPNPSARPAVTTSVLPEPVIDPPPTNVSIPTTAAAEVNSAVPGPTMPLLCSQSEVIESLDIDTYLVVGCDEQWSVLQMHPTCNGPPCEQVQLLAVWGGPNDDYQLGYNTYPFSYCRDRVARDGAPTWLLDSLPWPNCDGNEAAIEYLDEPATGALRRGDRGPRVATLQRSLIEGEFSGVFPADGYFGWNTERAVRLSQQDSLLPVTGIADEAYLEHRGVSTAPCLSTTPFDARVAITITGDATCEQASQRWSDYLRRAATGVPVVFGDGWTCDLAYDPSGVSYSADDGRCESSLASFDVIGLARPCPAPTDLDSLVEQSGTASTGHFDQSVTLMQLIPDAVLATTCQASQVTGFGVFLSDGVTYRISNAYRDAREVCADLAVVSFGDPDVAADVRATLKC